MPNSFFCQDLKGKNSKIVAKHEISCAEEGKVQQEDSFKKALEMIKLLMHASTEVGSDLNLASESTSAETSLVIKEAEREEDPKEIEEDIELEEMEEEAVSNRVVVELVLQEVVEEAMEKGRGEWGMEIVVEEEGEENEKQEELKLGEVEEDNIYDGGSENGGGEVKGMRWGSWKSVKRMGIKSIF